MSMILLGLALTLTFAIYWLRVQHGGIQDALTPSFLFLAFAAICVQVSSTCTAP